MTTRLALAHGAASLLLVAGCTSSGDGGRPAANASASAELRVPMFGKLTVTGQDNVSKREPYTCVGVGGYTDLAVGTPVTVYDDKGTIVGSGRVDSTRFDETAAGGAGCSFFFSVRDLPVRQRYEVEVAKRGRQAVRAEDVSRVDLTVS